MNELQPHTLEMLHPTVGTFEDEHRSESDTLVARWYKGASVEHFHSVVFDSYVDSHVKSILREYAEERLAKGIKGVPKFVPGPIGAAPRYHRMYVPTEREVADYHRREREGNRKLMLELRARNDASLAALLEGWR